jgi:four helix bundle protein
MKTHKDLEVWQKGMQLVKDIYFSTSAFPKSEQYGIVNQIRKAAVSVPANIAEGSARGSDKEFRYFLRVSFASLTELETLWLLSSQLGHINPNEYNFIQAQIIKLSSLLSNLIKSSD